MRKLLRYTFFMLLIAFTAISIDCCYAQSWQWAKSGNNIFSESYFGTGTTMATDPHGNLYVISTDSVIKTSGHYRPGYSKRNLCVVSYDCQGNYRWSKMIENGVSEEIKADKLGGIYVAGFVLAKDKSVKLDEDTIIGATHKKYLIVKFDTSGHFKWLRMPESDSLIHLRPAFTPFNICVSDVGDIRLLASVLPGVFCEGKYVVSDTLPAHIIAFNSNGDFVKGIFLDVEKRVAFTNMVWDYQNDKYYFSQIFCDKLRIGATYLEDKGPVICRFNHLGASDWIKSGSSSCVTPYPYNFCGINLTYKGSFYVVFYAQPGAVFDGYTFTNDSNKGTTAVIIKYDKDGNRSWAFNSKEGYPYGFCLAVSDNEVGIFGSMNVHSSPFIKWADGYEVGRSFKSSGNPFKDSFNLGTFFITVDDNTGNILTLDSLLGAGLGPKYICGNNKSGFYMTGGMDGIIKRMVIPNVDTLSGSTNSALFLLKYGDNDCGKLNIPKQELVSENPVKIYPNPGTDFVNIEAAMPNTSFRIFNLLGQLVSEYSLKTSNQQITVQNLSQGVYLFELRDSDGNIRNFKFIKL